MSDSVRDDRAPAGATVRAEVAKFGTGEIRQRRDQLAVEEPLEIRVVVEKEGRRSRHSVAVTMRTPGHDFELAAGFLFTEGVLPGQKAVWRIAYCEETTASDEGNIVEVFLSPDVSFDPARFSRNVYTTSSCGICGKTSIDLVRVGCPDLLEGNFEMSSEDLLRLPDMVMDAQPAFSRTGGLHASGLIDAQGKLLMLREDVGRHNALDKLIGALVLEEALPATDTLVVVSGRASFELVQKALMAGIPVLAAVGAPSSLAVELAKEFDMTLVGFLRNGRFNVYSGRNRILA